MSGSQPFTAHQSRPDESESDPPRSPDTFPDRNRSGRKNATVACTGCRRKHMKCSGIPPPCAKFDTECRFYMEADRRTTAVKRGRLEELENDQRRLKALLTNLRDNPMVHAGRITTLLQQDGWDHVASKNERDSTESSSIPEFSSHATMEDSRQMSPRSDYTSQRTLLEDGENLNTTRQALRPKSQISATSLAPGAVRSFGNLAMSDAVRANQYPADTQARQLQVFRGRIETLLPLNVYTDTGGRASTAVNAALSFQHAARSQIAQGIPARKVLSMDTSDLDLFYRNRTPGDDFTVAGWACEFAKVWTGFPLEVRLASAYYSGSFMRWLILPCKETYEMMSPLVRPLQSQLMIPHTIDVDLWGAPPAMREVQLLYGQGLLNRVTSSTQRLHWPHDPDLCTTAVQTPCTAASPGAVADGRGGHHRTMHHFSPEFTKFLDQAENWSIHRDLLDEMPELRGHVRLHDD